MLQRYITPFYHQCFKFSPLLPIRSEAEAEAPRELVRRLEANLEPLHADQENFLYVVRPLLADYEAKRPEYEAARDAALEALAAEQEAATVEVEPEPEPAEEPKPKGRRAR